MTYLYRMVVCFQSGLVFKAGGETRQLRLFLSRVSNGATLKDKESHHENSFA